jgi:hypothetical protein
METVIRFALSNFTFNLLVIGLVCSAPRPWSNGQVVEALLSYFLLFSIGVSYVYNFIMHVFFGAFTARFIGWEDSPFQAEVGFASLGFAAIGFLAFRGSRDMRLAAVLGPALFLWGAAAGHVYQMITAHNFEPGNAGMIFITDVLLPIIGFALLWLERKYPATQPSEAPASQPRPVGAVQQPASRRAD